MVPGVIATQARPRFIWQLTLGSMTRWLICKSLAVGHYVQAVQSPGTVAAGEHEAGRAGFAGPIAWVQASCKPSAKRRSGRTSTAGRQFIVQLTLT